MSESTAILVGITACILVLIFGITGSMLLYQNYTTDGHRHAAHEHEHNHPHPIPYHEHSQQARY